MDKRFSRDYSLKILKSTPAWEIIIIGGGGTGLGAALDAASRGYKTLLLEQADFAKGTSSRSTKLVHGGVRYLAQGNISLVYEALHERGLLLKNAPHLVHMQLFIIPCYSWWGQIFYGAGLKVYDWMAMRFRFKKTAFLSARKVAELLPNILNKGLKGGVGYYDGQFDDARLAINIAQTCVEKNGVVLNYVKVSGLLRDGKGMISGVKAVDTRSGQEFHLQSKVVINATGVFVDEILQMDSPLRQPLVRYSQGVHVVLDSSFLKGKDALMIPKTPDGRVLFALPWHGHVLVGTTDTPLDKNSIEPVALENEVNFILDTAGQYLVHKPARKDVLSVFAGLRPLAASGKDTGKTKEISRSHKLIVSPSGLVTITGGKWTTYRRMAEDTINEAIKVGGLPAKPCATSELKIHGHVDRLPSLGHLAIYGSDAPSIQNLVKERPALGEKLHEMFPHIQAEVVWAIHHEMAMTVEDVLARRLRVLFLNARAAIDMAPQVARLMAMELNYDGDWQRKQVEDFTALAHGYLLEPYTPVFNKVSLQQ